MTTTAEPSLKRAKLDSNEDDVGSSSVSKDNVNEVKIETYVDIKVKESDCAITEYLGTHKGFSGILRTRYSDFVVHEITKTGEVVKLTSTEAPDDDGEDIVSSRDDNSFSTSFLTDEDIAEVEAVKSGESESHSIDVSTLTKEERTSLHRYIAETFRGLETNTTKEDGATKIRVTRRGKNSRKRSEWPSKRPDHLHFTLYQEGRGTFDATYKVANLLGCTPKNFQYAGSKDKRGVSSQRMSAYRVPAYKLLKINEHTTKYVPPLAIGNVEYKPHKVKLGNLSGNRFDIVMKQVVYSDEQDVEEAMNSLATNGSINYYGTQRFGFKHIPSNRIGLAMLREQWKEAVELILSERPIDFQSTHKAQSMSYNECMRLWKDSRDAAKVYREFGWRFSNEGLLLRSLAKFGRNNQSDNYYSALFSLPRNNRNIFLHAYQSLMWNKLANYRIKQYGAVVVPGDLLVLDQDVPPGNDSDDEDISVQPVLADESNIKRASVFDIVLPVLGHKTLLPDNLVKDKLIELLRDDGLDLEKFTSRAKTLGLTGDYRKMLVKPEGLSWSLGSYEDPKTALIQTDLQALNGLHPDDIQDKSLHEKKLIKLSFSLPSSTYATVLIRELLKKDVVEYSLSKQN